MNHNEQYHTDLTGRFLAGEATPAQEEELLAWAKQRPEHQRQLDELAQVWEWSGQAAQPQPFEADMASAWSNIEAATQSAQTAVIRPLTRPARVLHLRRWSIAATVALALGVGVWWLARPAKTPQLVEIQTAAQQKQELSLPDGSHIWLNENSKISYAAEFDKRSVTLEGEAFFEVEKLAGKPFEILSGHATTTVLGTTFNVRAYPKEDKIEVSVEEGKVRLAVTNAAEKSVLLEKGESGIVRKREEKVEKAQAEIINAGAWKTEQLTFDDAPMQDVTQSLERFFGTSIEVSDPNILYCHYNGDFEKQALPDILEVITSSINLTWEKTDTGYRITGEGCKPDN